MHLDQILRFRQSCCLCSVKLVAQLLVKSSSQVLLGTAVALTLFILSCRRFLYLYMNNVRFYIHTFVFVVIREGMSGAAGQAEDADLLVQPTIIKRIFDCLTLFCTLTV